MIAIILRTFRDRWKMLLAVTVIGVGTMLMYTSLFPTYRDILAKNNQLYSQMPGALRKAFNIESFSFDTIEKFLNIEMYSLFMPILTIILTLSLSSNSIAGEVERETSVQSATQSVSRTTVYLGKLLAAIKIFSIFNVLVNFSVFPLAALFKLPIQTGHFVAATVMCELFGLALLGIGFGVSAFLSDKGKVQMIVAGTVLVTYTLNIVSSLLPSLDKLKYLSFFHYFDPNVFLVQGRYQAADIWYFSAITVVGITIGWWRWTKRDIL